MRDRPISRPLSTLDNGKTRISVDASGEIRTCNCSSNNRGQPPAPFKPRNHCDQFSLIRYQVKKQMEEERGRLEKETEILK
jgi:hypothetical protein